MSAILAIFGVLLLGLMLWWRALGRVVLRDVKITVSPWPAALSGLRIAVLSDLHIGAPRMGPEALRRIVDRVRLRAPDLAVVLGDLVVHRVKGGHFVAPEVTSKILADLGAPTFAVLGNHDHQLDAARVTRALTGAGITVLVNDCHAHEVRGQPLQIAGADDCVRGKPDLPRTLAAAPAGSPILLLTHSPDLFPEVPPGVSLMLAGHTHGGQIRLPFIGAPRVPSRFGQRYARGLIEENGRKLFVTTGLGTSWMPIRIRVPPEVVIIELVADVK